MSAHTPGPWNIFDDEIVASWTDVHVADVALCDGMNPTERQANRHLIAAAPDLLAALKTARRVLEVACGTTAPYIREAFKQIDVAIDKAEGR